MKNRFSHQRWQRIPGLNEEELQSKRKTNLFIIESIESIDNYR